MKDATKIVISRRRALRQASLAIGAAVTAPTMISVSALGEWAASSTGERPAMDSPSGEPAKEAHEAAIKYGVLRSSGAADHSAPVIIDGIPFLKNTALALKKEGGSASLRDLNIEAKHLYLYGCVNSVDAPHYNWGGTDDFKAQFVGDRAGDLRIHYRSGIADTIPLLFGYTLWWHEGYSVSPEPFKSNASKRAMLDRALYVADGISGGSAPYYLRIDLRDQPVVGIELFDDSSHVGCPVIDGVTFADLSSESLDAARFIAADGGATLDGLTVWLAEHSVMSNDPLPRTRQDALHDLKRAIYTFPDDIDARTISRIDRVDPTHSFSGAEVSFSGPAEANILTNVFLENSIGLLGRVDDDTGMVHESAAKAANYMGWVGYQPDLQAYYDDSYTRTHFITLLSDMGFLAKADKAIDYFDRWMMYFPKSYPALQLGGKPVPGHATVIANDPHVYFDKLTKLGNWPTKFKTRDYGNPETDGHGILMLGRHRAWAKAGRKEEWIEQRWDAIHEAAEWIPWCLDNPQLSFSEHGLLYAESEGGLDIESLYCNVPCYFGLLAYAEMAEVVGKTEFAVRWHAQAERLLSAMNAYFPANIEPWGDVWDPEKTGGWGLATASAPILESMELYGYDAANLLPAGWVERSKRTYAMQSAKRKPSYCDPSAMGYGQGFITQSALLLDQMDDATHMTEWMARFCFAPRQPHPYRVPESVEMKSDSSMWCRGGDLGNGFQMGGVLLACHILLGIDDFDANALKLIPRLPFGWTGVSVHKWPVRVLSSGHSEMVMLSMELTRDKDCRKCEVNLSVDKPIDNLAIRLGPFPISAKGITVENNGKNTDATIFKSGDSKWAWFHVGQMIESCNIRSRTT